MPREFCVAPDSNPEARQSTWNPDAGTLNPSGTWNPALGTARSRLCLNIVVPQLGESVVEARVARWLKKVGDAVTPGEPVVELETDKIDLEVGADQAGVLARIDRQEGEDVKVGELLAVVETGAGASAGAPAPAACRRLQPPAASRQPPCRQRSSPAASQPPRRPPPT